MQVMVFPLLFLLRLFAMLKRSQIPWLVLFLTPATVVVVMFIVAPLFASMFNSFFAWDGFVRQGFVGFENFVDIFRVYPYNEQFPNALKNNLTWFVMSMLVQNTIGIFFGYLLSRNIRGYDLYKRLFFMPVLLSIIAVGFLWKLYYNPQFGLFFSLFKNLHIEHLYHAWLGDAATATPALIVMNIWRWIGFPTLVFLAAFDNVPVDCIEGAYLEGAGAWRIFWKIQVPLVVPSFMIITVLTLIGSINVFEQVYALAGLDGAPNYATDTLSLLFYRTAFGSQASTVPIVGIGSALSVIIYMLCIGFSFLSIKFFQSKEVEQ